MALTRDFKATVAARVRNEPRFAQALLQEALDAMLQGDVQVGKALIRDFINATIGFERLGQEIATPPKSLMRMFSATGNPQARNLFAVVQALQAQAGVRFRVVPLSPPGRARPRAVAG